MIPFVGILIFFELFSHVSGLVTYFLTSSDKETKPFYFLKYFGHQPSAADRKPFTANPRQDLEFEQLMRLALCAGEKE